MAFARKDAVPPDVLNLPGLLIGGSQTPVVGRKNKNEKLAKYKLLIKTIFSFALSNQKSTTSQHIQVSKTPQTLDWQQTQ
jgi:hypothetical protein